MRQITFIQLGGVINFCQADLFFSPLKTYLSISLHISISYSFTVQLCGHQFLLPKCYAPLLELFGSSMKSHLHFLRGHIESYWFSLYFLCPFHIVLDFFSFLKFFPRWMAPNLITFTGFLLTIVNFFLIGYYDFNFDAANHIHKTIIPNWVWIVASINIFVAYTLGKIRKNFVAWPKWMNTIVGCPSNGNQFEQFQMVSMESKLDVLERADH